MSLEEKSILGKDLYPKRNTVERDGYKVEVVYWKTVKARNTGELFARGKVTLSGHDIKNVKVGNRILPAFLTNGDCDITEKIKQKIISRYDKKPDMGLIEGLVGEALKPYQTKY